MYSSHNSKAAAEKPVSHRILKKLAYLTSARWIREAFQAVFLIYLARHSANTYGEFMLALGLGSILVLVAEFGLNLPLVGFISQENQDPGEALSRVSILKGGLLGVAMLGVVGFLHWQQYSRPLQQIMLVIGAGVGLEALSSTFFVALQVQGRQDLEGKIKTLAAGLGFGYGFITLIAGASPLVVAFFKLIETLANLAGGIGLIIFRSQLHWRFPSLNHLGATARQGLVFALLGVTAIIYNKANLFFLQRYGGSEQVAQYSATWQMVDGFTFLVSGLLLQSIMFPLFVKLWEVDRNEVSRLARDTGRWLLAAALPLMFILYCERDRLITLIYGPNYQDAVWLQKYLVITILFAFIHNLAAFLMMSMKRERLLLVFYLGGLVFNLLWCSQVIPAIPLLGAALAIILTKGGVAVLTISYIQRHLGLFTPKALSQLAAVVLSGLTLYLLSTGPLPREVAEALALAPLMGLGWHWWRGRHKMN